MTAIRPEGFVRRGLASVRAALPEAALSLDRRSARSKNRAYHPQADRFGGPRLATVWPLPVTRRRKNESLKRWVAAPGSSPPPTSRLRSTTGSGWTLAWHVSSSGAGLTSESVTGASLAPGLGRELAWPRPHCAGRGDWLPLVVGLVPLVVGVAFLPPSGLAVMLGCLRVVKHVGDVGRFALGAGGPLVPSGGALMRPAPTLDLLVMLVLVVASHRMSLPAGRPLTMFFGAMARVRRDGALHPSYGMPPTAPSPISVSRHRPTAEQARQAVRCCRPAPGCAHS